MCSGRHSFVVVVKIDVVGIAVFEVRVSPPVVVVFIELCEKK
jgi:hypothetical protein